MIARTKPRMNNREWKDMEAILEQIRLQEKLPQSAENDAKITQLIASLEKYETCAERA